MTTALEGGEGSALRPGRSLSPGKTRYPFYRRLGGTQCRSGQVRKISPPPGFDPRTVQPVASRYTDYATRPTIYYSIPSIFVTELFRAQNLCSININVRHSALCHTLYFYLSVSHNYHNKQRLFINRLFCIMERQLKESYLMECYGL